MIPESQDTHGMALFMNSASVAMFSILTCFSTSRYNSGKIIHEYPFGTEKKNVCEANITMGEYVVCNCVLAKPWETIIS